MREEWQQKGAVVNCPCMPRKKPQMEKVDKEIQKIMKVEMKINLKVSNGK